MQMRETVHPHSHRDEACRHHSTQPCLSAHSMFLRQEFVFTNWMKSVLFSFLFTDEDSLQATVGEVGW